MKNSFLKFAAVAAIAFGAAGAAYAQDCSCTIVNGCKQITFYDAAGNITDQILDCGSSGSGTFNCTREVPPGPINQTYTPVDIKATIKDAKYGEITTTLDPKRGSSKTTLVSNADNDKDQQFPATLTLSFYATATVSSQPDVTYTSRSELVFQSTNIQSVNPFQKETLKLAKTVEFEDADGNVAFTLDAGSTDVTLN